MKPFTDILIMIPSMRVFKIDFEDESK